MNREGALIQRHSARMLPLCLIHFRQIVPGDGRQAVLRAELFLKDGKGPLQHWFRIGEASLILIHHGDVIQAFCRFAVIGAEHLFTNFSSALMERFRLCVQSLEPVELTQVRQTCSRLRMSRSIDALSDCQGFLEQRFGAGIPA